jgi:hypothetical protein
VATNTINSGITTASKVAKIFFDLFEEALMISLDDRSMTSRMAINAPPTPPLRTAVMEIALVVALAATVDDAIITKLITAMFRLLVLYNLNLAATNSVG